MMPRIMTEKVWVKVTINPSRIPSIALPRVPIIYAAIMVLPCPGSKACRAPRAIAPRYKTIS
jgi:hypothetical protein